jgi:hypothetical protein
MRKETVLQYLLRGGRIQRIPSASKPAPKARIILGSDSGVLDELEALRQRRIVH